MKLFGRSFPLTIRTRLTLLYGGAFFVAGVVMVVLLYVYLAQVLDQQLIVRLDQTVGPGPAATAAPPPDGIAVEAQRIAVQFREARLNTLDTMLIGSLVLVAVLALAAGGIGWLLAGQALQPLRSITATARRVADRSLHERVALSGPSDEIKDLADTFDAMLERLDRAFDGQRRFVANASHELRTPLTITRTLLEVALLDDKAASETKQLAGTLLAVNQRHERLIDGLLTLAGSEQRTLEPTLLDFAEVAAFVATELQPVAAAAVVELRTDLAPLPVEGDAFLLERLVRNLVENAIRYNLPEGGWVRIATEGAELVIENTGPVVPAYEIPSLFEPFRRAAGADRLAEAGRSGLPRGAGLGLSIVRSVAAAHGGRVEATPREGGGLMIRVGLPAAAVPGD